MNINVLRTPEGLNKYLNEIIKTLPVKIPDRMLQMFLWQKIKFDFLFDDDLKENKFEDNEKQLFVIKTEGSSINLMIGYLHIPDDLHINNPNYSTIISKKANQIANDLTRLSFEHQWNNNQIFIISTFRLSSYKKIDLTNFPNSAKYFYLTDNADQNEKYYELGKDDKTNEFMEGDEMLKELLKRGKRTDSFSNYWSCHICDGNNDTGCLYFDPTECPRL